MPRVRIQPAGLDLEVGAGESVAEAAWRQDLPWPTRCWGRAECMACFTRILAGELAAVPAQEEERQAVRTRMADRMRNDPLVRLACRLQVGGNGLVLHKAGVQAVAPPENHRRTDVSMTTRHRKSE